MFLQVGQDLKKSGTELSLSQFRVGQTFLSCPLSHDAVPKKYKKISVILY